MAGTIVQPNPGPVEAPQTRRRTPQRTLDAVIRRAVLRELRRHEGNLSRTARELGIARQTLLNYLDAWGLKVRDGGRTCRVMPAEARAYHALKNQFESSPKERERRLRHTWADPGIRELTRRDMATLQHGNSDELARQVETDYWETMGDS